MSPAGTLYNGQTVRYLILQDNRDAWLVYLSHIYVYNHLFYPVLQQKNFASLLHNRANTSISQYIVYGIVLTFTNDRST